MPEGESVTNGPGGVEEPRVIQDGQTEFIVGSIDLIDATAGEVLCMETRGSMR